jgi:hypothetical protein
MTYNSEQLATLDDLESLALNLNDYMLKSDIVIEAGQVTITKNGVSIVVDGTNL